MRLGQFSAEHVVVDVVEDEVPELLEEVGEAEVVAVDPLCQGVQPAQGGVAPVPDDAVDAEHEGVEQVEDLPALPVVAVPLPRGDQERIQVGRPPGQEKPVDRARQPAPFPPALRDVPHRVERVPQAAGVGRNVGSWKHR